MNYLKNKITKRIVIFFVILAMVFWLMPGNLIFGEGEGSDSSGGDQTIEETSPPVTTEDTAPATTEEEVTPPATDETTVDTTATDQTIDTTEDTGSAETTDDTTTDTTEVAQPVLTIELILPSAIIDAGSNFKYKLRLTNNGIGEATNVSLKTHIPENVTYISNTTNGKFDEDTNNITWNFPKFAAGDSLETEIEVGVPTVIASDELKTITASIECAEIATPGSIKTEFTVKSLEVAADNSNNADGSVTQDGPNGPETSGGTDTATTTGESAVTTDTIAVTTDTTTTTETTETTTEESVNSTDTTTTDTSTTDITTTETTAAATNGIVEEIVTEETVPNPLTITMTDNPDPVGAGQSVTYTINYANGGTILLTNITLTDFIPSGTVFVSASGGSEVAGETVVWQIDTLEPGQSGSVEVTVHVPQSSAEGSIYINTAVIDSNETDAVSATEDTLDPVPSGSQTFYVFGWAPDVLDLLSSGSAPGYDADEDAGIRSVLSISNGVSGQVYAYLHSYSDPLDFDPINPSTSQNFQSLPGYDLGSDAIIINPGEVLTIDDLIYSNYTPDSGNYLTWLLAGGDLLYILGGPVNVVRGLAPVTVDGDSGNVLAEFFNLYPTNVWDTDYIVPVGIDTLENTQSSGSGSATAVSTTADEDVDSSEDRIDVNSASSFTSSGYIIIDSEIMQYTDRHTFGQDSLGGLTRGALGTTATTHANGATVYQYVFVNHGSGEDMEYTDLMVQAMEDNTEITIVNNGVPTIIILDEGENYILQGYSQVYQNATISADKLIQAGLITSSGGNYDTRNYNLTADKLLGSDYFIPVVTETQDRLYIYAFEDNTEVKIEDGVTTTIIRLNAGQVDSSYLISSSSTRALHITSYQVGNELIKKTVRILGAADSNGADKDWGFQAIDSQYYSSSYVTPYAPGDIPSIDYGTATQTDESVDLSETTIDVDNASDFSSLGYIIIDSEIMQYTVRDTSGQESFGGLTRGALGTTIATHADNTPVYQYDNTGNASWNPLYVTPTSSNAIIYVDWNGDGIADSPSGTVNGNAIALNIYGIGKLWDVLEGDGDNGGAHIWALGYTTTQYDSRNLNSNISNSTTTILANGSISSYSSSGYIKIDNEIIKYTGKSGNSFTGCVRGQFGTGSASHNAGAAIYQFVGGTGDWSTDKDNANVKLITVYYGEASGADSTLGYDWGYSLVPLSPEFVAQLVINKTSDPTSGSDVSPGDTIVYTLSYKNTGNTAADNVVITDTIPANTTLVPGSISSPGTESGGVITWNFSSIAANQQGTVSFSVTVNSPLPPEVTEIENFGSIDSDQTTLLASNHVEHNVVRSDISVTKDADVTEAEVGQTITYSYTVENTGDVTLNPVTLSDDLLGPVPLFTDTTYTVPVTSLAPGATAYGYLTTVVAVTDFDPIENTVTATGTTPSGVDVTDTADESVDKLAPTPPPASTPTPTPTLTILTVAGITEGTIQVLAFTGMDPIIPISGGSAVIAGLAILIASLRRRHLENLKHENKDK